MYQRIGTVCTKGNELDTLILKGNCLAGGLHFNLRSSAYYVSSIFAHCMTVLDMKSSGRCGLSTSVCKIFHLIVVSCYYVGPEISDDNLSNGQYVI